ncbi:hypothetical protein DL762_006402 [Monosporascus cannonballus]|uniref:Protein NO VEIN C-terminal domain-containing protein n=1 Tax=Monosporascus cannonballus TaxID=155416 RepID=A0ABY0H250_9PEZI|nr:hypothetical protein DL762_006402 [Monosporascus cannonballus]
MASGNAAERRARARRFVESLADEHGHLGEDVYSTMTAETRRRVEEALLIKDQIIGASVITLAKNLYSKDVRFIFELLQNADDNSYSRARGAGDVPFVSFRIYRDCIVVECNEDGFTEANLRAICNIGKSSKTGAQGYIGEKGIGFKSVFKVAWKVHIQSGDYSFCFKHRKGQSGMGMISPEWEAPSEAIVDPLTRTTLFLHGDSEEVDGAARQSIASQLNELQPTMLLFLKNLKQISIRFYDDDECEVSSSLLSIDYCGGWTQPVLKKTETQNGATRCTQQKYHVIKTTARGLPKNENREYNADEEERRAYATAPVILAFPLSEDDVPMIEPQEVFAFLPVRRAGFNFLIQSDFVTQANREDVVTTSQRNIRLLDAIADAFATGVKQLCEHPTLRYQWMRYLPELSGYPWDPFWRTLVDKIKTAICSKNLIFLRDSFLLVKLDQARRLTRQNVDKYGNPLFDDLPFPSASYISRSYEEGDLEILDRFGLKYLPQNELLERVTPDLLRENSRMKSPDTDDDWHSRAAWILSLSFDKNWRSEISETRRLDLIPLCDGKWVSSRDGDVLFPETEDEIPIPTDLGLQLVSPEAFKVGDRVDLFKHLGVKFVSNQEVRSKIIQKYQSPKVQYRFESCLWHLRFLYLSHTDDHTPATYDDLKVIDTKNRLCPIRSRDFYRADEHPYALWTLYRASDEHPGLDNVRFVNPNYFEDPPDMPEQHALTWEEWFHEHLGIRRHSRLVSVGGLSPSRECEYVETCLPAKLLGFLKYNWAAESRRMESDLSPLQKLVVPCEGGLEVLIDEAYLPLPTLKNLRSRFIPADEPIAFPFLALDDDLADATQASSWDFLTKLGVKRDPDLHFHLDILRYMGEYPVTEERFVEVSRVLDLYKSIHGACIASSDTRKDQAHIRDFFQEHICVLIPTGGEKEFDWASPDDCLLDAPASMESKHPVMERYKQALSQSNIGEPTIRQFFGDTLKIPGCKWEDFVVELEHLKNEESRNSDHIREVYERLKRQRTFGISAQEIKSKFESGALVFYPHGGEEQTWWYRPSQCLWSAPTQLRGKVNLSSQYDDELQDFFVGTVGVRELDAAMIYNELLNIDTATAAVGHIKDLIWSLNSQLQIEPLDSPPEGLLQRRILPVRYADGQVRLCSIAKDFAIVDRKKLGAVFQDRIETLDVTMTEVRQLQPFIEWSGLGGRYLSHLVKEITLLDSGVRAPISDPIQDIRRKAYALYRIAKHFQSPRIKDNDQALYDLLRSSQTWETDEILSQLIISMDGKSISEQTSSSQVHIEDLASQLKIYVPEEEGSRDACYLSALPRRLVEWAMTDPVTQIQDQIDPDMVVATTAILNTKFLAVERLLDEHGIIESDLVNRDAEEEEAQDMTRSAPSDPSRLTPREPTPSGRERSSSASSITRIMTPTSRRYSDSDDDERPTRPTPATNLTESRNHSPSRPTSSYSHYSGRDCGSPDPFRGSYERRRSAANVYRELLSQVVVAARRSRILGSAFNLAGLAEALPGGPTAAAGRVFDEFSLFGVGVYSQIERDKMVGAAGELFVFEVLASLAPSLPGFSRENWRSTIRRYATEHPEYADMCSWAGVETSDLEYEDEGGTLTDALVRHEFLADEHRGRRLRYYIEVKTTPGPCDAPFFMSHAQYEKMKRFSTRDSIYIIFRVFNLYTNQVNVKLYVDPAKLEREGQLVFTADRWTVKPGAGPRLN